MGSKPITARAAAKVYANSVAKNNGLVEGSAKVYGSGKSRQITIPGVTTTTENYTGGGRFKNQEERDWFNEQIKKRTDAGMSPEEALQDYRNTFNIGEKKTTTTKTPDQQKTVIDPGYEGTLKTVDKGQVKSTFDYRQAERKIRKSTRDYARELRKTGTNRKEAKALAEKYGAGLRGDLRARAAQEIASGKSAGQSYITGQRDMLQGELSTEEQRRMLADKYKRDQALQTQESAENKPATTASVSDKAKGYAEKYIGQIGGRTFQETQSYLGNAKPGEPGGYRQLFKADTSGLESMAVKKGSPAYKMKGYGSKTYKK